MVVVFVGFGLVSSFTWLLFGTGLRRIVSEPKTVRIFNLAMAAVLVASLIPVFFEG
jgi:threonine/homoserine/homoserine lactone efflux protein